jgi:hypothetical protein
MYVGRPLNIARRADFEFENTTISSDVISSLSKSNTIYRRTFSSFYFCCLIGAVLSAVSKNSFICGDGVSITHMPPLLH